AGFDELAGGGWLGINDQGVLAGILNREGTLGPLDGKRSRGELVLEALDHPDAVLAADALSNLDPTAYRPFNLVVADNRDAYFLSSRGDGHIRVRPVGEGVTMVTASDPNDQSHPRIRRYLPLFRTAAVPEPETGDWSAWEDLLASRRHDEDAGPRGAMCFVTEDGFGTTSAALIALPNIRRPDLAPVWRFAPGRPDETPWNDVPLT
ncbi:MAG TPA: NRDE family protein, partial [Arenibaculum sp.]|nr:NRDE family protein [Arenibaculum sp.]